MSVCVCARACVCVERVDITDTGGHVYEAEQCVCVCVCIKRVDITDTGGHVYEAEQCVCVRVYKKSGHDRHWWSCIRG